MEKGTVTIIVTEIKKVNISAYPDLIGNANIALGIFGIPISIAGFSIWKKPNSNSLGITPPKITGIGRIFSTDDKVLWGQIALEISRAYLRKSKEFNN